MTLFPRFFQKPRVISFCLFFIPVLAWLFCIRRFLFGDLAFGPDAASYHDHIKFYLDQLSRGVFPLWDPLWNYGVPNDFFLRRICPYNPFLLLILLLQKLGFSFMAGYRLYLAGYFLTGSAGFYLLARRVLKDAGAAYAAWLFLVFSAQSTRIFDSYFLFVFIPGVWFFYFLTAFTQTPRKLFFLGLTFSLMILVTTYVPFHFLTIFLVFVPSFAIVYAKEIPRIFKNYAGFIKTHKLVTIFCLAALIISLVPGILFFLNAKDGEIVLPRRHYFLESSNDALQVDIKTIEKRNMLEEIVFAYDCGFSHLPQFQGETFYMPIFIYLVILLGLFTPLNRRLILFALWAVLMFITASPHLPVYGFLYRHVFYFKYFRNPHFFLWLLILPLFILYAAEQLRLIFATTYGGPRRRFLSAAFITLVHAWFAWWLVSKESVSPGTYATVLFSWLFFIAHCFRPGRIHFAALALLVATQPVEVFHYLQANTLTGNFNHYPIYHSGQLDPSPVREDIRSSLERQQNPAPVELNVSEALKVQSPPVYYATPLYYRLLEFSDQQTALQKNLVHKFVLYDHVEQVDYAHFPFDKLFDIFRNGRNTALIPQGEVFSDGLRAEAVSGPVLIEGDTRAFRLTGFDANSVKLETNFSEEKFLVYNDCYHSGWRAFVNGHPVQVIQANYAFKGVRIPAGLQRVEFRFGSLWRYFLNGILMMLFYGIFISLAVLSRRRGDE